MWRNGQVRILVCASAAPIAPFDGMRTQLRALLDQLAPRHDVTVVAPRWPGQDGPPPAGVDVRWVPAPPHSAGRARPALSLLRRQPVDVVRLAPSMVEATAVALGTSGFDVAHVGLGELACLADVLAAVPTVLAPLDAWRGTRGRSRVGGRRTRAWLRAQASLVDRYVATPTDPSAPWSQCRPRTRRRSTAPIRRRAPWSSPTGSTPRTTDRIVRCARRPAAGVHGCAAHAGQRGCGGRAGAARVMPVVRAQLPDARLAIVGRAPGPAVQALASASDRVQVVADVPDVRPWLWRAGAFVAPMDVGTGVKNKLLEAMACATACVTTPLGTRGMDVVDGDQLLIRESTDDMAAAVTALLADPGARGRPGRQGQAPRGRAPRLGGGGAPLRVAVRGGLRQRFEAGRLRRHAERAPTGSLPRRPVVHGDLDRGRQVAVVEPGGAQAAEHRRAPNVPSRRQVHERSTAPDSSGCADTVRNSRS